MHTRLLSLVLLFLVPACDQKDEDVKSENCVRVKLQKELCGQAVIEILDPTHFDKGQDWTDWDGVNYQNVFSTILPCGIPDHLTAGTGALQSDIEFYIQFANSMTDDDCARCKALLDGPDKFSYIEIITNCAEPGEE